MSSKLYCYVNAKKLLNKTTFKFHCRERIRQSIRNIKCPASRYLTLFSCSKLICSHARDLYARGQPQSICILLEVLNTLLSEYT